MVAAEGVADETLEQCQIERLPGKPGEPLLVRSNVPQLLVHDGVDVGGGGDLFLEQEWSWSQLGLNLQGENLWRQGRSRTWPSRSRPQW